MLKFYGILKAVPKIGLSTFHVLVLVSMTVSAVAVDAFPWEADEEQRPVTWGKAVGVAIVLAGAVKVATDETAGGPILRRGRGMLRRGKERAENILQLGRDLLRRGRGLLLRRGGEEDPGQGQGLESRTMQSSPVGEEGLFPGVSE